MNRGGIEDLHIGKRSTIQPSEGQQVKLGTHMNELTKIPFC